MQQMLLNLSMALLATYLLFLFGIDNKDKKELCTVVAGLLHYFLLAAFAWMTAEALIRSYAYIDTMRNGHSYIQSKVIVITTVLCWGRSVLTASDNSFLPNSSLSKEDSLCVANLLHDV